ncbi:retrovirus-related pol polyprotein from transposon TNT 1-94 [Tanacetum coccineum]
MTIIETKWVFRNKLDENGVVSQNKARLVAQGYNQQEGINYDETYAPVARLESIRIILAYACDLDFKLFQMDVKSAFLNGFINEEKQTALAISTTEAEYVSARKACQQALWMKQALIYYDVRLDDVPIMCDNKGAIDLSKYPVQHSRTKHIKIRHYFLCDNVQKGHISIEKVPSVVNIADILTKPLKRESFNYLLLLVKKRPRPDSEEESSKKQKLEEDNDAEKEELRDSMDVVPRDDVAIDVESLATKYPIVDWKIHILNENMMYYQIIRADGSSKNDKIFSEMLDDLTDKM